jgi:seryl-tRNA synthetase
MLQLARFSDNKEEIIAGLKKRNFPNPEKTVEEVILLDSKRKETQTELDATLAESNLISKEIGQLMQQGKKEEAEKIKSRTAELKAKSKSLGELLQKLETDLTSLLYQIPNIPHQLVPSGVGADDNEVVLSHGEIPKLHDAALPHCPQPSARQRGAIDPPLRPFPPA